MTSTKDSKMERMTLTEMYTLLENEGITVEQAAAMLGLTTTGLSMRIGRWGHRLPLLLATLDKIAVDKITREEASSVLGVTTRQVNMLMQSWHIQRPLKDYLVTRASAKVKWELRKTSAIDFVAGSCTIEEAAENAGVSDRQMRRWVSELVHKHFNIVYGDLKKMALHKRKRLAEEIETKENLDIQKQQVMRSITRGESSVEEVAVDRLLGSRTRRESNGVRR